MLEPLESDCWNWAGNVCHAHRRLVALINEIPYINSCCFCDENYSRSCWREGSTCVWSILSVRRSEDRCFVISEWCLPNAKVKVMNSEQQVFVEGRTSKLKHGSEISFWLVVLKDIINNHILFLRLEPFLLVSRRFHRPINHHKIAFITWTPNVRIRLILSKQDSSQSQLSSSISSIELNLLEWFPNDIFVLCILFSSFLLWHMSWIPYQNHSILSTSCNMSIYVVVWILLIDFYWLWNEFDVIDCSSVRILDHWEHYMSVFHDSVSVLFIIVIEYFLIIVIISLVSYLRIFLLLLYLWSFFCCVPKSYLTSHCSSK